MRSFMNKGRFRGKLRTTSNLAFHSSQSATSRQEEELMQSSARSLEHLNDPIETLRLLCLSRGANGIMLLCRVFRRMDDDGTRALNREDFVKGLRETGLNLSHEEASDLFSKLDSEEKGSISVDEFIQRIPPPMPEIRRSIVEEVYRKLDKTGDGFVTVQDLCDLYCVKAHPKYMNGDETAETILTNFLANFEKKGDCPDGTVTLEEFMNYYSGISVSIDNDCYFNLMMRQTYKL